MGWLGDLFGAVRNGIDETRQVVLPPVAVREERRSDDFVIGDGLVTRPSGGAQYLDLRALDPVAAFTTGLRVGLELGRARMPAHRRGIVLSDAAARAFADLDEEDRAKLAERIRERTPPAWTDAPDIAIALPQDYEALRGRVEVRMSWDAFSALQHAPLGDGVIAMPLTGPLSSDLGAALGPPPTKGATIRVPLAPPDYCHARGVIGAGILWGDEAIFDLRRAAPGGRNALAEAFAVARAAAKVLPRTRKRTWIVAPWLEPWAPFDDVAATTKAARAALATNPARATEQIALDGELAPEFRAWIDALGVPTTTAAVPVGDSFAQRYPTLAQHFMLDYAATEK